MGDLAQLLDPYVQSAVIGFVAGLPFGAIAARRLGKRRRRLDIRDLQDRYNRMIAGRPELQSEATSLDIETPVRTLRAGQRNRRAA